MGRNSMIEFGHTGNFDKFEKYLRKANKALKGEDILEQYGRAGVRALMAATPVQTGLAASSWDYNIERGEGFCRINFTNSDIENGCPVAILIQYGHATKNGGWVEGIDYINPAIRPIFDEITKKVWKEVVE